MDDAPSMKSAALVWTGDLAPGLASELELARAVILEAKSAATRRAYATDWRQFTAWLTLQGAATTTPVGPELVVLYLTSLLRSGKKLATIERALISICQAHRAAETATPREHEVVRSFMKGLRRSLRDEKRQRAPPLLPDEVKKLIDVQDDSPRGLRNRAILLVGFFGAFRRSELVALDRDDVREESSGLVVRIRFSKTDQQGQGESVGLPRARDARYCPAAAITAWNATRDDDEKALFIALDRAHHGERLAPQGVARVLAGACAGAGVDGSYTPHSLRAGFATSAARDGKAEWAIRRQTRHKSLAMLHQYIREADIWRQNAGDNLLR